MRFHRRTYAKTVLRAGLLGALVVSSCASSFAAPNVDALIQTPFLNELTSYDAAQINNPLFFGFDANFVAPLNITNLLPQNGIVSIADSGSTVYGLIRTSGFNELTAYNRTQINNLDFFGFDANFVAPLNITNLLPQNSHHLDRRQPQYGVGTYPDLRLQRTHGLRHQSDQPSGFSSASTPNSWRR
jgi:hypothetical protein